MNNKFLFGLTILLWALSVASCNMLRGAGQDITNAGNSIQRTVDHND